jgi:hypothetical protein
MPPHTSTVPGNSGSTVPAKPKTIKAIDKTHIKVISKGTFQNRAGIFGGFEMLVPGKTSMERLRWITPFRTSVLVVGNVCHCLQLARMRWATWPKFTSVAGVLQKLLFVPANHCGDVNDR